MYGDITEENQVGQRSYMLPWFWRLSGDKPESDEIDPALKECEQWSMIYHSVNNRAHCSLQSELVSR